MSESTRVATATAVSDPAVTSDSDLCWRNVIKINLEARQQASSYVGASSTNSDALSSLPSVGYSTSNATVNSNVTNKQSSSPSSSSSSSSAEVIVVSDEENPSSPDSTCLVLSTNMNKLPNKQGSNDTLTTETSEPSVQALRELLQKEENKLSVLKTIHGLQGSVPTNKTSSSIQGSALNKASGRSSGSGSGRKSPNLRASQPKHSIVVVPGNQATRSTTSGLVSGSKTTSNSGISSRLQHIVDNVAADQAFPEKLHSGATATASGKVAGSKVAGSKVAGNMTNKLVTVSTPPVPGLMSISTSSSLKHNSITSFNDKLFQFTSASKIKPHIITTSSNRSSSHEIITISDSPMGKNPPPLLSSTVPNSSSTIRLPKVSMNGSVYIPTISVHGNMSNSFNNLQAAENTRRYREHVLKQSHAKRNFQKQIERKMVVAPYPKTFRQVWPLIPVHDSSFVRNYGLESVICQFDPSSKVLLEKSNSKVKPICNQCSCDFASAWQIRKSNSKQLLLCEACDFQNLKILQRSKLSNQLKELMESIKVEQEKFAAECEETRKEMLKLEKQAAESPPPLTSQLVGHLITTTSSGHTQRGGVGNAVGKVILNSQVSNRHQVVTSTSDSVNKQVPVKPHVRSNGTSLNQKRQQQHHTSVIPSILGQRSVSPQFGSEGKIEVGSKRPVPVDADTSQDAPPSSKVYKPGSALDHTLNKLSKQLIKRKLDEQRQECQQQQRELSPEVSGKNETSEVENSVNKEVVSPTSPLPAGQKSKSRRKGTPKHKRLLSASSMNSE